MRPSFGTHPEKGRDAPMGPFLMWKSGGPASTFIYHDSDKGNVKMISGSPALKFIIALCDTECMLFYNEDDGRSEKGHMREEY